MNATYHRVWKSTSRPILAVVAISALLGATGFAWKYFKGLGKPKQQFVLYTVTKADLPIVVTERGNLESQVRTEIRCEVENSSVDRSGVPGTQIIFIVPNGSAVKQGDLLVELDSAAIRDRLDRQTLDLQKAISARIQGQAKYENQKTQNETAEAEASLKCDLADLQLQMYTDTTSGEYKLAMDEIERSIDEAKNLILESQAALELQKTEKSGIQTLFELGYRGKSDLDQSRFKFLQAEDKLTSAVNKLTTSQAQREQMKRYVYEMKRKQLQGDLDTARRTLKQVKTDNESKLSQAEAAKVEAEGVEAKETERLAKLKTQLEKCKIFAPHDGMAVYARENRYSNETEIAEGVTVRERQQILSLPDLTKMQIKTQIHEAVLDQIQPGLPVTVRVDAFPTRRYVGIVEDVAVVPTSSGWGGSSVKTYDCVIRIPERVESLKPGMTAVVDIHADRIRNIVAVPVQAIFQIDKDHWCYVSGPAGPEKKKVELGRSNDKFVHITAGLDVDHQIVLNPMSLLEATDASGQDIAPDADAPDVPDLPLEKSVERIAGNAAPKAGASTKAGAAKAKRSRPKAPPKGNDAAVQPSDAVQAAGAG